MARTGEHRNKFCRRQFIAKQLAGIKAVKSVRFIQHRAPRKHILRRLNVGNLDTRFGKQYSVSGGLCGGTPEDGKQAIFAFGNQVIWLAAG